MAEHICYAYIYWSSTNTKQNILIQNMFSLAVWLSSLHVCFPEKKVLGFESHQNHENVYNFNHQSMCSTNSVKPGLHLNTNRMQMWHTKTMRTFDVDMLPRCGKQYSAVQRVFGK